ncbi:GNAT family N-acetyltransferase [Methylonatrum kenyense]|uniref:GNAT family N-acetyltransferase n=1 Tax=Methylonatrum kenyense TaxID=455253 RepID=UPI0020BF484B|nr:GNAT family N-acetyltransferase [Methylonatrum kenyense]MCK8515718.1 GNAT family N-acetyltransferase [Methylonatrum kenyense]
MQIEITGRIDSIAAADWDALALDDNPFLRHAFLQALEQTGCVGGGTGWHPNHFLLRDDNGALLGAMPAYLKTHSRGEFVFDWGWAEAFARAGGRYYPKLVIAVPFTPATGPRVLAGGEIDRPLAIRALTEAARDFCQHQGLSSMHCLFCEEGEAEEQQAQGLLRRLGCQFHWTNPGYRDFEEFLVTFSSKKRKNVKRERRLAREQATDFRILRGDQVSAGHWQQFHRYYSDTFHLYGNLPPLNLDFLHAVSESMGEQVLMAQALDADGLLAGALLFRSDSTLYGRYWGCREERQGVHFETCFYQGIDYCIRHGLRRFEPGAQGEHKIARGFLPTATHSCHWLEHPGLRAAVADFLDRETPLVRRYMATMDGHAPFRDTSSKVVEPAMRAISR